MSTTATSGQRIADYDVVSTLDRAGATYLLAQPPARLGIADHLVTIKVVDGNHEPHRFRRMTDELKVFASVSSEYLVTLYDAGSDNGRLWYSMRHHPDGSLGAPAHPVSEVDRLLAVAAAARGAHALHEAGLAHRDIQPDNILLGSPHAVLADLELARVLTPGQTITRTAPVGSLEYTDPAIVRGERGSRASDIWALGVTLHRVLTDASIYPRMLARDGVLQAIRIMLADGPTIDSRLRPDVADLVRRCLAPDPTDRPLTAEAVAEQIEALARS